MALSIFPQNNLTYLDELKVSLEGLKRTKERRNAICVWAIFVLWVPVSVVFLKTYGEELCGGWFGISVAYLIVVGFLFEFIESKTQLARDITQLTSQIGIENERIRDEKRVRIIETLSALKSEYDERRTEMFFIEDAIRRKRKWRDEFDSFPLILERNRQLDRVADKAFRQAISELKQVDYSEYIKWIGSRRGYVTYGWLAWRFENMKAWEAPLPSLRSRETMDVYDEAEERRDKERILDEAPPIDIELEPVVDETISTVNPSQRSDEQSRQRGKIERPKQPKPPLNNEFTLSEKPLSEMPNQRSASKTVRHRRIKVSEELRQQIEARKIRIGELGELAVMEDERERLKRLGERHTEPVHVALTDDGKGYDIQSWRDGREIFIEVKTTVGDFWSGLYFTENEKIAMEERLKEQYCLYRICNFDVNTGIGSLFIYAGEKLITDTFEFNSHRYLLSERHSDR